MGHKKLNFAFFILVPFLCELAPLAGSGVTGLELPDLTVRAGIEGILKLFREGQDSFRGTAKRFYEMHIYSISHSGRAIKMHELCSVLLYLLAS